MLKTRAFHISNFVTGGYHCNQYKFIRFSRNVPLNVKCNPIRTVSINVELPLHSNRIAGSFRRVLVANQDGIPGDELVQTRNAVSDILQESGVSLEESEVISSNCPKYINMLIESVHELDELSLWSTWNSDKRDIEDLSFKDKVYQIAKEKGDKGIFPFLESAGLNTSSSMLVARYLSSETLPDVISKVKYVKEILFSRGDEVEIFIGKKARRMMSNLSIDVDDGIQQTLSFFEKMEARRGGLNMLDSGDASFPYLIESFPRLLLRSIELHFKPLVEFLETIGVPKRHIKTILLLFPPIIFCDIEKDIKPKLQTFMRIAVEVKDIGKMLSKYPWILAPSVQKNFDVVLSFFEMEKVPEDRAHRAIKSWPHLLGCSTGKMKLMVEELGELGIKNKRLGQVVGSSPQLLIKKPHEFVEIISFMMELGFDEESVGRILCRCPELFASSIDNTLKVKIKVLTDFGISQHHLPRVIRKYPELLVSDVKQSLLPRANYLMHLGISKKEVISMIYRFSPLLSYNIDKALKPKLEFLLHTMHRSIKDVVEYPRYFSYSLEKKIKPRFWVLKRRNIECNLQEMLGKNDEEFAAEYLGLGRMLIPSIYPGNYERS